MVIVPQPANEKQSFYFSSDCIVIELHNMNRRELILNIVNIDIHCLDKIVVLRKPVADYAFIRGTL